MDKKTLAEIEFKACWLIAFAVLSLIIFASGCRTCPPCVSQKEIVEVKIPYYECPEWLNIPPLELPDYPPCPEDPEKLNEWYADMVEAYKVRERILEERAALLERLVNICEENEG